METTQNVAPQTTPTSEPPPPVRLTDKAAAMVKETIERENLGSSGLRVAVVHHLEHRERVDPKQHVMAIRGHPRRVLGDPH